MLELRDGPLEKGWVGWDIFSLHEFVFCSSLVQEFYFYGLRWSNTVNIFSQLVAQQCCIASCTIIWRVLPPCYKLQQHVARSRSGFCFVQHVAATCNRVVIRAILQCNLQHNIFLIVVRQIARKCCPYNYFTFTLCTFFSLQDWNSKHLKHSTQIFFFNTFLVCTDYFFLLFCPAQFFVWYPPPPPPSLF